MIQSMSYDKLNREYHRLLKIIKLARKIIMVSNKQCIYKDENLQIEYRELCNNFIGETKEFENE